VICWVAQEHACDGAQAELVGCGGGLIRIAQATEDTKMVIGGRRAEEEFVWCDRASSPARSSVKEIGRHGERLHPERGRRVRMKEHGANAVVQGTQCALCLAVLCRGMWERIGGTQCRRPRSICGG
jgi:hypothetical protein